MGELVKLYDKQLYAREGQHGRSHGEYVIRAMEVEAAAHNYNFLSELEQSGKMDMFFIKISEAWERAGDNAENKRQKRDDYGKALSWCVITLRDESREAAEKRLNMKIGAAKGPDLEFALRKI